MPSVPYAQAKLLSRCEVGSSYFDSLTTDMFFPLLDILEVEGGCFSYPIIRDADKPTTIAYTASGGAISVDPVQYGASADLSLKQMVVRAVVTGDLVANVGNIHSVARDQALALARLVQEKVSQQLWAETPSAEAPAGMVAFAADNPGGVATAAGALDIEEVACLQERVSPLHPSAPLYYVMHPKLYRQLHARAREYGAPLEYFVDPRVGAPVPHLEGIPVIQCGQISLDEVPGSRSSVYLVRVGSSPTDPAKIAGVCRFHPRGETEVRVEPLRAPDTSADEFYAEVSWSIGFANRSRTSVARLKEVKV